AGLTSEGRYSSTLPFLDSDLYKWLEAVGWALADPDLDADAGARLEEFLTTSAKLLAAAQEEDGYLDSNFQVNFPGERFAQLTWGHELYCAGHLIQAAVALHRTAADDRVLEVARRVADLVVRSFGTGPDQVDGVDGHPEIESALVELYRETGERSYLDAARYFVDRRGHGLLGADRFGSHYFQDHLPVREAPTVEGHSVRQLYLLAGVADVYVEDGDASLLEAADRLWHEMVATKTYLTGGIGTHHTDEAFGDPYELTNERSYCETCAAIASVMFSWRMLMITGQARYADLVERTLYNGFLAGLSLDGQRYIYANPLQVRDGHMSGGNDRDYARKPWFKCACCPPNVMRTLASLEHYVVLGGASGLTVHQFVEGTWTALVGSSEATVSVRTDYPWDGEVRIRVDASPGTWGLTVRVPHWATSASVSVNGQDVEPVTADGWLTVTRDWVEGDELVLELPLEARFTRADERVDADRASVALERGPLVYCFESVDNAGQRLDDVILDPTGAVEVGATDPALPDDVVTLAARGRVRPRPTESWWPYPDASTPRAAASEAVTLTAVPYYVWGNRAEGAMRIWTPAE
ncbi:MAG TPA: beta-L-arabinofuranosidase domain-containing protein, partial [Friedmanniella sp.]